MAIVLLSWLSHYFILKAAGHFSLRFFKNLKFSWFDELLTGFCALSLLSVVLGFFIPLNAWVHGALLISSFVYLFFNKNVFPVLKINPGQIVITLIILILAVPVPNHGDSAFYHAQALSWVEKFRVIPGLGNFFGRIAFNSSFFNVQGLFSLHPFLSIPSRFLNSFLILSWFLYLFQNFSNKNATLHQRFLSILFACITLCVTRGWVSTIAPDVAVGLFLIIISYKISIGALFNDHIIPVYLLFLFFTAVTIKLSAVLLLPVVLAYILFFYKLHWKLVILPAFILIPWLVRSVILSGYLIYPYLPLSIWQPDWTLPPDLALIERNWITSWARMPGEPWTYVLSLPFSQWFPHWFASQYFINKVLIIAFSFMFLCLFLKFIKTLFSKTEIPLHIKLALVWSLSIIAWFITAPDFRFGYGLMLPFLIFSLFSFIRPFNFFNEKLLVFAKAGFLALLTTLMVYVIVKEKTPLQNLVLTPEAYPEIPPEKIKMDGVIIYSAPGDESCWNSPLPCINDDLFPENIELRGPTLQKGFRPKNKK